MFTVGLFLTTLLVLFNTSNGQELHTAIEKGDVMVGILLTQNDISQSRMQNILTIVQTIKANPTIQGLKVGYAIVTPDQNCSKVISFLQQYPQLVAFINIGSNDAARQMAVKLAALISSIRVPTYTAASAILLDNVLLYSNMNYMQRLTSSVHSQTTGRSAGSLGAVPSILTELGVDIVTVTYSAESDNVAMYAELSKVLSELKIDIENTDETSEEYFASLDDMGEVGGLIKRIKRNSASGRMTTLVTLDYIGKGKLLRLLKDENLTDILIVSSSRNCRTSFDEAFKDQNVHFIRLCQSGYTDEKETNTQNRLRTFNVTKNEKEGSFEEFAYNWYEGNKEYYGGGCSTGIPDTVGGLTFCRSDDDNYYSRYNRRIQIAIEGTLTALGNITKSVLIDHGKRGPKEILNSAIGEELLEGYSRSAQGDFDFDEEGVRYNGFEVIYSGRVGTIANGSDLSVEWTENSEKIGPFNDAMRLIKKGLLGEAGLGSGKRINCSAPCRPGDKQNKLSDFINCWTCSKCTENTINNGSDSSRCHECPSKTIHLWANPTHTACDLEPISVNISTWHGQLVLVFVGLSICLWLTTLGFYIKFWTNKIIVASGRYLSSIIFTGLLIGFIEAILVASSPTDELCAVIQVLAHFFMASVSIPVFVKTLRICLLFNFSTRWGKSLSTYMSTPGVLLQSTVLAVPQMVLMAVGLAGSDTRFGTYFEVSESLIETVDNPGDVASSYVVNKSCAPNSMTVMYISIAYSALTLLGSTALGWQCRKLPDNYKESLHIFISSLISLVLICAYVPAMVMMKGNLQVFFLSLVVAIIALTFNLLIFGPKIYACLFYSAEVQRSMSKNRPSMVTTSVKDPEAKVEKLNPVIENQGNQEQFV